MTWGSSWLIFTQQGDTFDFDFAFWDSDDLDHGGWDTKIGNSFGQCHTGAPQIGFTVIPPSTKLIQYGGY